jgi:apolipoprotein N-acyltransferase
VRAARSIPLVVGAAAATALSVAPFGWWPLGPVGLAMLAVAWWHSPSRRRRAALGFLWAYVQLGITSFWIVEFQAAGLVVLLAMMATFWAVGGALLPTAGRARAVAFTGIVAGAEALRGHIPFGGFPMGGIPLGQADSPLSPVARIGGTALLTLVACALGGAIAESFEQHWRRTLALAIPALALAAVGTALPAGRVIGDIRIAAVQGGGERGTRALETAPDEALMRHLEASREIEPGSVDVVLWPENAVTADGTFTGSPQEELLIREAQRLQAVLLVGVVEDAGPGRFRNAEIAISPDGSISGRYDKVHRVPFGEYAPLRSLVAKVADLALLPSDAIPGDRPGVLRGRYGETLGVVISYEVFFGDRARAAIGSGGQVLLVPTNASSYQTAQVPDQEIAAARLRAWETGRDVLQAAPTGFSASVDTRGRVSGRTDLGARGVIVRTLPRRVGTTPYQRTGDAPWLFLTLLCVAGPVVAGLMRRQAS